MASHAEREIAELEAQHQALKAAYPQPEQGGWASWVDDDGQFHEVRTGPDGPGTGTGTCGVPGCRVNHTAPARPRPGAGLSPAQQGRRAMAGHAERLVGGLPRQRCWPG